MTIADNGVGFDIQKKRSGIGVANSRLVQKPSGPLLHLFCASLTSY
jgi:hypothetical protein